MPRKVRKAIILLKVETVPQTDAAPVVASNTMQVMDWEDDIEDLMAPLPIIKGFFGGDDRLPYARFGRIRFRVPFASAGAAAITAGTAPAWGAPMLGCAVAEATTAASRTEYKPATEGLKTVTIWFHRDGLLMKFVGGMGNHIWNYAVGEAPYLEFRFSGLVTATPAAAANPSGVSTAWQPPLAVGPINTAKVVLGGAYATAAITGGTAWDMKSFSGDAGNDLRDVLQATGQAVDIFNRDSKATVNLDLTAAGEATYLAMKAAGTKTSVGLVHGSAAGSKLITFAPAAQIISLKPAKDGEMFTHTMELELKPTSAGNDEWVHVAA